MQDLEDLRGELEVSADATVVQKDIQKKREEEVIDLKKQVEEEAKEHDKQMTTLRQKHNQMAEELNNQLDQIKRNKNSVGKAHLLLLRNEIWEPFIESKK